ncbi:MAG: sulfite exporter TauE/SafE family protein [Actinomycetota bacterium]|nr:sulfite exporter TauE/SafE family protein [Actinomycetota bacterium]
MAPGLLRDILALVLGLLSGVLSGAVGVGGAIVTTPGVRLLGASAFLALGTTLPPIVLSAASGSARYAREGLVDWRVLAVTAPAGVVAAVGGSLASHAVPGEGHLLMVFTAGLLLLSAWRMVRPRRSATPGGERRSDPGPSPAEAVKHYSLVAAAGVGSAAGLLSGLLGIGGGALLVPAYSEIMGLPLKTSIATSLACVGILAIPGTITHAALGDVDWRLAALLTVGVLPGARLGAGLAIGAEHRRLQLAVAVLLGGIGLFYGAGELAAL